MGRLRCVFVLGLVVFAVSAATPQASAPPARMFEQAPQSTGVVIDNAFNDSNGATCVWFTVKRPDITDVELAVTFGGENPGSLDGKLELLPVWGPFPKPVHNYDSDPSVGAQGCMSDGGSNMDAVLTGVRYQNGNTWHAVPEIPETTANVPQSGVSVDATAVYAGAQPIGWNESQWSYGQGVPTFECVDVTNTAMKPIAHVQVGFAYLDGNGTPLANSDPLDIRAAIAPGATLHTSCRPFRATISPNEFYYGKLAAEGIPATRAPQLLVNGKSASVRAMVSVVDFSDGTSWKVGP